MGADLNVQIEKVFIRYKQGTLRNKSRIKYNYDGYELFCIMLKSIKKQPLYACRRKVAFLNYL